MPTIKDIAPESVFTIELNAGTPGRQGPKGEQGIQGIQGPKGEPGPKPIRGIDYFTQQDISNMVTTVTGNSNSAFNENVANKTKEFNANVSAKTSAFDNNAVLKTEEFNANANSKKTDFNLNANNRTTEFNTNASNKKNEIDTHVTNKTTEFDNHVVEKIKEFKEETSEYVTETELESKGYLVESDLNDYAKEEDLFSGSYNDLKDKPKIPSKTSELTNDKGFINAIPSEYVTEEEQNEFIKPYNKRITENEKYISDLEATIDILTNTDTKKGELVHITDALPLPVFENKIDGNVEQEGEPSPASPQEIEVLEGYNLFDKNNANVIDGYFHGTTPNITSNPDRKIIYIPTKPNTTYTISTPENIITSNMFAVGYTSELPAIGIEVKNINYSSGRIKTITTGEDALYLVALIYRDGYTLSYEEVLDGFQIVKGTENKPYLPYGHIGYKVNGKNLFNKESSNIIVGKYLNENGGQVSDSQLSISDYMKVQPNKEYSFQPFQNLGAKACFYDKNKKFLSSIGMYSVNPNLTTPNNCAYIRISFNKLYIDSIQVELGDKSTPYEPYQEQIVYLDLKENEVVKGDNIIIDKKGNVSLAKNMTKHIFTGNETIVGVWRDNVTPRYGWRIAIDNAKINTDTKAITNVLSNYYLKNSQDTLYSDSTISSGICLRTNYSEIIIKDNTITTSTDETTVNNAFRNKLKEKYESGNPVIAYYPTEETEIIPLGKIEPIKTFEGVNNIQLLANIPTEIEVKYALDVKKYFDNKLASIQEQIL